MSSKFEEIVLEELFKLTTKVDNLQLQMQGMATKEDLKKFATKEDLKKFATKEDLKKFATKEDIKDMATKEDLKKFATKEDMDKKFEEQTKEIATMFQDAFKLSDKYHREMEERITKATDQKIDNLRKEFLYQLNVRSK